METYRLDDIDSLTVRFYRRVNFTTEGCWIWIGSRLPAGYGTLGYRKRTIYAHRLSVELHREPIPAGLQIDHLCRVKSCVNPDHLEVVTPSENLRRIYGGRCKRGHEFTPENTAATPAGKRRCRTCQRAWRRSKNGWQGHEGQGWEASKTHCPQGHAYDEVNTYIGKRGNRLCRACHRANVSAANSRKRTALTI